ncbi:MAG TPA: hypothetical protein VNU94_06415 [Acidobacteriaceae bacterium]|nr:hypothetical protein [Acidobacteriaceae bacterium]
MNCQRCQNELATLLLDNAHPAAAAVQAHVDNCPACAAELNALRSTIKLMDDWRAPSPSPFFDTRLHARLREESAAAPAGFWERLRLRVAFNSNLQMRPMAAGALAVLLLASGGGYAGFNALHPRQPVVSAAVQDLQSLDKNEQTIATMDQLLDDGSVSDPGNQGNDQSSGQDSGSQMNP